MDRTERTILHDLSEFRFPNAFAFKTDTPSPDLETIVERLVRYHRLMQAEIRRGKLRQADDMWTAIGRHHRPLADALDASDIAAVSDILVNICKTPASYGLMHALDYATLAASPTESLSEAIRIVDRMIALGEALGCQPVQCPEQGHWGYKDLDLVSLYRGIQARLPMDMTPPAAGGGTYGVITDKGVICVKDLEAMYTATRVLALIERTERKSVCEIGGGTGTLAYYLAKAGAADITVFDLPMVSVIQGYYLMRSLGPDQVWLFGETPGSARIRTPAPLGTGQRAELASRAVPEPGLDARDRSHGGPGLSAPDPRQGRETVPQPQSGRPLHQHKRGGPVGRLRAGGAGRGYRRLYRFPYWMRAGYVEELYEVL